jgi:peptidoglycan/LPS O-acetylase OafA/YrhL
MTQQATAAAGRTHNNFDALRLIAAIAVMLSHSVQLSYGDETRELVFRLSHGQTNAGAMAVDVFFAMSGYLITGSFLRSNQAADFVIARMLRLLPALAVVLLLLSFVAGPLLSTLPPRAYFSSPSVYQFVARNLIYPYGGTLPGVFLANPLHGVINGSLWTLRIELGCYLGVFVLGMLRWLDRFKVAAFYLASLIAVAVFTSDVRAALAASFLGGAAIYVWRPPLHGWVAALCAIGWAGSLLTGWEPLGTGVCTPYLVIYLALSPSIRLPSLARIGDLSYGTYIYAYPVQQIIVGAMAGAAAWYYTFAFAVPVVLPLAYISWRLVEAPSLAQKHRFRRWPRRVLRPV